MKIGIIGGGASGMMAALAAAQAGARAAVLEKNDRIGKKILVTGNGKCNFSNLSFSDSCFYSQQKEKAMEIYNRLTPEQTAAFFEQLGMRVIQKNGYLYPASGQASTVLDILRLALEEAGVRVVCEAEVLQAERKQRASGFRVRCANGAQYEFDRLILTCGGQAAPRTGSDGGGYRLAERFGHRLIRPVPALVQLRCKEGFLKSISGVRCDARVTLLVDGRPEASERGELQLTDYGISGIVVFQLSRIAACALAEGRRVEALLDLLPEDDENTLRNMAETRYAAHRERQAESFFTGIAHKKWIQYLMKANGFAPQERMTKYSAGQAAGLVCSMKRIRLTVTGTNSFEQAQVTAGGVSLDEILPTTESRLVQGLYLAGELLDVDGKCGGYNLQWAWSSGYTAGVCAAKDRREAW